MQLQILLLSFAASIANAATITVTRTHQAVCPANSSGIVFYPTSSTSASRSNPGLPSVSPSAPADIAISNGAPFRINIIPYAPGPAKRQAAAAGGWLRSDGYVTSNPSEAATFTLVDGQLAADGWLESTSSDVNQQIFAGSPSDSVAPITRSFEIYNGAVRWYSSTFDNGEARFYYASSPQPSAAASGLMERQNAGYALMVVFHGDPAPGWYQVSMGGSLIPNSSASSIVPLTTPVPTQTSTSIPNGPGLASNALMASSATQTSNTPMLSPNSPMHSSSKGLSVGSISVSTATPSEVMQSSSPALSLSSPTQGAVSTNGMCGPNYGGMTCHGSEFGNCCSRYGVCGSESDFCSTGCMSGYGDCSLVSSNTVALPSLSIVSVSISSSIEVVSTSQATIVMQSVPTSTMVQLPPISTATIISFAGATSSSGVSAGSSRGDFSSVLGRGSIVTSSLPTMQLPVSSAPATSMMAAVSSMQTAVSSSMPSVALSSARLVLSSLVAMSLPAVTPSSSRGVAAPSLSAPYIQSSASPAASSSVSAGGTGTVPCTNVATPLSCVGSASNGSFYNNAMVECFTDYPGGDLGNLPAGVQGATAATLEVCIDRCRSYSGCAAATWTSGPKSCYMKGAVLGRTYGVSTVWAFYFPYPGQTCLGPSSSVVNSSAPAVMLSFQMPVMSSSASVVAPNVVRSSLAAIVSPFVITSSLVAALPSSIGVLSSSALPQASAGPLISKRGLVYVPSKNAAIKAIDDQIWIRPGSPLSFYYNYDYIASSVYDNFPQMQFVPMLWGDYSNNFFNQTVSYLYQGRNITHTLGFNEPDGPGSEGGSNVTPARAAARWIQDIEPLHQYGLKLGAPAITGSSRGITWLQDWMTACNGSCNPDFMVMHYYGNFQDVASFLGWLSSTFPGKPVWVTEFADAYDTLSSTQLYFNNTISYFDRTGTVERYSYFGAFRSDVANTGYNATFLDQCGNLTDIGAWYMNMPSKALGVIPQSSACPASYSPSAMPSTKTSPSPAVAATYSVAPVVSPSSAAIMSSSYAPAYTTTIQSTVWLSPSPVSPSSPSQMMSSSTTSSSVTPAGPTCYRSDLHIGPMATGVPEISCITNIAWSDDYFSMMSLPFNVTIFQQSDSNIYLSTNGFLSTGQGSSQFQNYPLPASIFDSTLTGIALPLWTDIVFDMNAGPTTSLGVYYVQTANSVSFEWVGHCNYDSFANCPLQFSVMYSTAAPGVWTFRYYNVYDNGASATVGMQGPGKGSTAIQFSNMAAREGAGTQVVCDTVNLMTCVASTFVFT